MDFIEPCFGIGHNLSLICQMTSEDIKHQLITKTATRQSRQQSRLGYSTDSYFTFVFFLWLYTRVTCAVPTDERIVSLLLLCVTPGCLRGGFGVHGMAFISLLPESCFSSALTLETTGKGACLTPLSCPVFLGLCRLHLCGTNEELQLSS